MVINCLFTQLQTATSINILSRNNPVLECSHRAGTVANTQGTRNWGFFIYLLTLSVTRETIQDALCSPVCSFEPLAAALAESILGGNNTAIFAIANLCAIVPNHVVMRCPWCMDACFRVTFGDSATRRRPPPSACATCPGRERRSNTSKNSRRQRGSPGHAFH